LLARPEANAADIGLRHDAGICESERSDAVDELLFNRNALFPGRGLRGDATVPLTGDEVVEGLFVLEQQHEPIVLEPRAETDTGLTEMHEGAFVAALLHRDSGPAGAGDDKAAFGRVEHRIAMRPLVQPCGGI